MQTLEVVKHQCDLFGKLIWATRPVAGHCNGIALTQCRIVRWSEGDRVVRRPGFFIFLAISYHASRTQLASSVGSVRQPFHIIQSKIRIRHSVQIAVGMSSGLFDTRLTWSRRILSGSASASTDVSLPLDLHESWPWTPIIHQELALPGINCLGPICFSLIELMINW